MISKKLAERLLTEFENGGKHGKTPAQALALFDALGIQYTKHEHGAWPVSYKGADGKTHTMQLTLNGRNLLPNDYSAIKKVCKEVFQRQQDSVAIVETLESTKMVFLKTYPQLRIKIAGKVKELATLEQIAMARLENIKREYQELCDGCERDYRMNFSVLGSKLTVSASDVGVSVDIDFTEIEAEVLITKIKEFKQKVADIYTARVEKLEQITARGGSYEEKDDGAFLVRPPAFCGRMFTVQTFGSLCIGREDAAKIDEAISRALNLKEVQAKGRRRSAEEKPAGLKIETGGDGTFVKRIVNTGAISETAKAAKGRLLELIKIARGVETKEEAFNGLHAILRVRKNVMQEYFDPEYDIHPGETKKEYLNDFKKRFLEFLEEKGAKPADDLNKAASDFNAVAKERTQVEGYRKA